MGIKETWKKVLLQKSYGKQILWFYANDKGICNKLLGYTNGKKIKDNKQYGGRKEWAKICEEDFILLGEYQRISKEMSWRKVNKFKLLFLICLKDSRVNVPKVQFAFAEVQSMGYYFSQELLQMNG